MWVVVSTSPVAASQPEDRGRNVTVRRVVPNITSERGPETVDFYVDLLGFEIAMEDHSVTTVVSPGNRTAQVNIIPRGDDGAAVAGTNPTLVAPQLSVEVEDVDAVHAFATEHGMAIPYPLTDEPWGVRRFFVTDPNGLVINVMSHTE